MTAGTLILTALKRAWCAETSCNPAAWSPDAPSRDQCAVTACVIKDLLGLEVCRGKAHLPGGETDSHYWNDGLDLTFDQFPEGTTIHPNPLPDGQDPYDYCMSNPDTRQRYALLKAKVLENLDAMTKTATTPR